MRTPVVIQDFERYLISTNMNVDDQYGIRHSVPQSTMLLVHPIQPTTRLSKHQVDAHLYPPEEGMALVDHMQAKLRFVSSMAIKNVFREKLVATIPGHNERRNKPSLSRNMD